MLFDFITNLLSFWLFSGRVVCSIKGDTFGFLFRFFRSSHRIKVITPKDLSSGISSPDFSLRWSLRRGSSIFVSLSGISNPDAFCIPLIQTQKVSTCLETYCCYLLLFPFILVPFVPIYL